MMAIDFERMVQDLHTPYMVLDKDLRFIYVNRRYLDVIHRAREELIGHYIFDVFPEAGEREEKFKAAFQKAIAGQCNSLVNEPFRIPVCAANGGGTKEVWWTCHHGPVYDADGNICGMVQHAEDVTVEVSEDHMRDAVSQEFGHRIKNLLATIVVVARRTANQATSLEQFVSVFGSRIEAMARTHTLLVDGGVDGMLLANLINAELQPFCGERRGMVSVSGPRIRLSAVQAQALGMALHELCTNAAKYGAFSTAEGRLNVNWRVEEKRLILQWRESGIMDLHPPKSTGFGSRIVDEVMPVQLDAEVERAFEPTGLRCVVKMPLD